MTALTAELFAHAIIGAARHYGDDPIDACEAAPGSNYRRALAPAIYGLHLVTGVSRVRICRIVGVSPEGSRTAKKRGGERFAKAQDAAREAVAGHLRARRAQAPAEKPEPAVEPEIAAAEAAPKPKGRQGFASMDPELRRKISVKGGQSVSAEKRAYAKDRELAAASGEKRHLPARALIEPAVAPQPAERQFQQFAGRIAALSRPPAPMRDPAATRGAKKADRPIIDLVLEALAAGPLNSMSLAYQLDRKEMAVSSALSQLAHEGLVTSQAVENGARRQVWTLAERVAA